MCDWRSLKANGPSALAVENPGADGQDFRTSPRNSPEYCRFRKAKSQRRAQPHEEEHFMKTGIKISLAFVAAAFAAPALANDSTGYLAAGGLVLTRTPDIEMRSEDLYVSEKEIRVRYRFFNTSKADIKTLVAFPIPDLPPLNDNDYALPGSDPVNFLGFETKVDGKPVANGIEQRAEADGSDCTGLLKSLNVPLSPVQEGTRNALNALGAEQKAKLVKAGIAREEEADYGKGMKKYLVPAWTLKSTFHWEQVFPARKELFVEHRYTPSVGGNVGFLINGDGKFNAGILAEYKTRYCVDSDFLAAVRRAQKAAGENRLLPETQLEYVLVTGANWAGPIKDFRLVADKGSPENLISFCATGVKKTGPTQFEVRYKDYTPDRNLQVLIVHRLQ
jgi:Domain of unknown function (DUF4424)